ncbi:U3 snoRNP protein [Maublancomyces gigas]|uniref:U3 snoRNP protein n=1 Tax=Discina gigas TaxID=1032678 RepID=A0ABR3GXX6_9PEZI
MAKKSRSATTVLDRPVPGNSNTEGKTKIKKAPGQDKEDRTPIAPDADELELERLIFGDLSGFKESLKQSGYEGGFPAAGSEDELDVEKREEKESGPGEDLATLNDDELFYTDAGSGEVNPAHVLHEDSELVVDNSHAPVWVDSDDERLTISLASYSQRRKLRDTEVDDVVSGTEYSRRLRRQFERVYPIPDWAIPPKEEPERKRQRRDSDSGSESSGSEMDMDEDQVSAPPLSVLLQSNQGWSRTNDRKSGAKLRPEVLDIARLIDANKTGGSMSGINALSFHPSHPLLLSSGLDSTIRLHHIDGKVNPPATSLHLRRTPINTALFHPDGKRVFAAGRRRYFHIWDLESGSIEKVTRIYGHQEEQKSMENFKLSPDGKWMGILGSKGAVNILDAHTSQWVATAKVDGKVQDISWYHDGSGLTIANKGGELWEYNVSRRSFTGRWRDEGGFATTVIANGGSRWVAVGSQSGIVNIYSRKISFGTGVGAIGTAMDPKPVKTLEQLVTAISVLSFSPDYQILCIASRGKKDALRMVHLPSCTVYKNWPTSKTPLGKVTTVAWAGKDTGMVAVGNEAGSVRLFEIKG